MASECKKDVFWIISAYANESMEELYSALRKLYSVQKRSFKKYYDKFENKLIPYMDFKNIKQLIKEGKFEAWKKKVKKCADSCIAVLEELSGKSKEMVSVAEKMEALDQKYEGTVEKLEEIEKSIKKCACEERFLKEIFSKLNDQHNALGLLVKMGRDVLKCAIEEIDALEQMKKDIEDFTEETPNLKEFGKQTRGRLGKLMKIFGFLLLREEVKLGVLTDTEKEEIKGMEAKSLDDIKKDMKKIVCDVNRIIKEEYSGSPKKVVKNKGS